MNNGCNDFPLFSGKTGDMKGVDKGRIAGPDFLNQGKIEPHH
jgi:hypothetical protein